VDGAVLVAGGTGFVAAYVIARLVKRGVRVRTTVRSPSQAWTVREHVAAAGAEPSEVGVVLGASDADPRTDADWAKALSGCRVLVWAPDPPALPQRASWPADGLDRFAEAARRHGVALIAAAPLWSEPGDPSAGVNLVAYGDVLGPLLGPDRASCLDVMGDVLELRTLGTPRRWLNIVDVRDLADLVAKLLDREAGPAMVVVGSAPVALPEMSRLLRDELGEAAGHASWLSLPDPVVRALARVRPKRWGPVVPELGHRRFIDDSAAIELLGRRLLPVEQTILDTARSFAKQRPRQDRANVPAWTPVSRL